MQATINSSPHIQLYESQKLARHFPPSWSSRASLIHDEKKKTFAGIRQGRGVVTNGERPPPKIRLSVSVARARCIQSPLEKWSDGRARIICVSRGRNENEANNSRRHTLQQAFAEAHANVFILSDTPLGVLIFMRSVRQNLYNYSPKCTCARALNFLEPFEVNFWHHLIKFNYVSVWWRLTLWRPLKSLCVKNILRTSLVERSNIPSIWAYFLHRFSC